MPVKEFGKLTIVDEVTKLNVVGYFRGSLCGYRTERITCRILAIFFSKPVT